MWQLVLGQTRICLDLELFRSIWSLGSTTIQLTSSRLPRNSTVVRQKCNAWLACEICSCCTLTAWLSSWDAQNTVDKFTEVRQKSPHQLLKSGKWIPIGETGQTILTFCSVTQHVRNKTENIINKLRIQSKPIIITNPHALIALSVSVTSSAHARAGCRLR